jgi:hypothetical protein
MNFLKQRSGLRIISVSATSLLCILLASVITQNGSSTGLLKKKPSVVLQASTTTLRLPCPPDDHSISRSCPPNDFQVALTSIAKDFHKQPLFVYTVGAGRIVGEGNTVTWDLSGVGPGFYSATVEVQDNKKHRALSSVTVTIANCGDCVDSFPCPPFLVACYDQVKAGTLAVCAAKMWPSSDLVTYVWSVNASSGEDLSGRISGRGASILIPTNGLAGQTVYVKVEVKGLDPSCGTTASSSMVVKP